MAASVPSVIRASPAFAGAHLYWEIARRGYRRYATYRVATLAGVFTNTVFGFMRAYVLLALFRARPHVGGYVVADALTYVWLAQGMLMTVYLWGWYDIAQRIRSGDVVTDFQRPVDFQLYWLAQDLGRALYHALFRGVPPFVVGAVAFTLTYPDSAARYGLFVLSVFLAVCLSFSIRFITNVLAFWVLDYRGVGGMVAVLWTFLSGAIVPLAILPAPWNTVTRALPFAGMMQTPIDVFLGVYRGIDVLGVVGLQAVWTVVLLGVGRGLLVRAERRLVIQGG